MQYQIVGDTLPAVICTVDANETLITENGAQLLGTKKKPMTIEEVYAAKNSKP